MKAARKARVSLRKKKRQRAKNKRLSKKGRPVKNYTQNLDREEVVVKKDSLKYRFAALQEDRYIIISFHKTEPVKTDSIFVRYNADGDDVLDYDKQLIKNYLDSNKIETISIINVREHFGDKKEDEQQNRHTSITKEHVVMFFAKLGIPREKIKVTNRK